MMDENVIPVNPKKKSRLKPAFWSGVALVFFTGLKSGAQNK